MDPQFANPYAAPGAPVLPAVEVAPIPDEYRPWTPTEIVQEAWDRLKADWPVVVGSVVLGYIAMIAVTAPLQVGFAFAFKGNWIGTVLSQVAAQLGGALLGCGTTAVSLASVRRQSPTLATFFSAFGRFLPYLGATIVFFICFAVGLVFLIVPGIIIGLGLSQMMYLTISRGMGPIEALKASWRMTDGNKGNIFVLGFLLLLIVFAGALACGVGLLVAVPLMFLGYGVVHVRLLPRLNAPPVEAMPVVPMNSGIP